VSGASRPPGGGLEAHQIKAIAFGLYTWALVVVALIFTSGGMGLGGWPLFAAVFLLGPAIGAAVGALSYFGAEQAGRAASAIYAPTGSSTPHMPTFSVQQALAMRGNVAAALASFEALMAGAPDDPHVKLAAAEMYASAGKDPARAAALYRESRLLPGATRGHEMTATNALIDLYRGPLGDKARMRAELRRLAERFAGTAPGEMARQALDAMKVEDREGTP